MPRKPLIFAVDFDGTLFDDAYPEIGAPRYDVIEYVKIQRKAGARLILWTCRTGDLLNAAVKRCEEVGLIFDAVNENLPEIIEEFGSDTRKVFANVYIDDRNSVTF